MVVNSNLVIDLQVLVYRQMNVTYGTIGNMNIEENPEEIVHIRASRETRKILKLIVAMTGETMQDGLNRILNKELNRITTSNEKIDDNRR